MAGDLDPVDYYGNEELMEHIWSNLISNAIRFTPTGGEITVVLRKEKDEITVSVSDTGIGMDEETQRHIFDKFYRAEPYPDNRGNGLGPTGARWCPCRSAAAPPSDPCSAAAWQSPV